QETRMCTRVAQPVLRVAVVRLTAVHDGVNETAVAIVDGLRDQMRRVQMIVPEQHRGANQLPRPLRKCRVDEQALERRVQLRYRLSDITRTGTEFWRFRSRQQ